MHWHVAGGVWGGVTITTHAIATNDKWMERSPYLPSKLTKKQSTTFTEGK